MGVSLIPQAQDVVSRTQQALQVITEGIDQVANAGRTVNQAATPPAPSGSTPTPMGSGFITELQQALAGVAGSLQDVHKAGKLQDLLPLAVFLLGILIGKPVLGAVLAFVLYLAGQQDATPAPVA